MSKDSEKCKDRKVRRISIREETSKHDGCGNSQAKPKEQAYRLSRSCVRRSEASEKGLVVADEIAIVSVRRSIVVITCESQQAVMKSEQ